MDTYILKMRLQAPNTLPEANGRGSADLDDCFA